eukprot:2102289-Pleurochrysis_carterae.AAC.1
MYSEPADLAARRRRQVRRISSLDWVSSRLCPRGISSSPSGWARSRTGAGLPSAAEAAEKNLETENEEQ